MTNMQINEILARYPEQKPTVLNYGQAHDDSQVLAWWEGTDDD